MIGQFWMGLGTRDGGVVGARGRASGEGLVGIGSWVRGAMWMGGWDGIVARGRGGG